LETADRLAEQHAASAGNRARAARSGRAAEIEGVLGSIGAAYLLASIGLCEREDASPENLVAAAEHCEAVRAQLQRLPTRERALLEALYFEDATLEEAGARLGISKSWASRVNAKALARLRRNLTGLGVSSPAST
jgi:RNA polymerase sigma factor for flagellar operon FliA